MVQEALDKPRNIHFKGTADLVTDTDRASEEAILASLRSQVPEHGFLGEEGGVSGNEQSEYLWCIDPIDGTTNFAAGYPAFAVSVAGQAKKHLDEINLFFIALMCCHVIPAMFYKVNSEPHASSWSAVLYNAVPVAATVVEFAGGPFAWATRQYTASQGSGAQCNGKALKVTSTSDVAQSLLVSTAAYHYTVAPIWHKCLEAACIACRKRFPVMLHIWQVLLHELLHDRDECFAQVTGFGYEHDQAWSANMELFKELTDLSRGVRRLGAAAVDLCHVALGKLFKAISVCCAICMKHPTIKQIILSKMSVSFLMHHNAYRTGTD